MRYKNISNDSQQSDLYKRYMIEYPSLRFELMGGGYVNMDYSKKSPKACIL